MAPTPVTETSLTTFVVAWRSAKRRKGSVGESKPRSLLLADIKHDTPRSHIPCRIADTKDQNIGPRRKCFGFEAEFFPNAVEQAVFGKDVCPLMAVHRKRGLGQTNKRVGRGRLDDRMI